MTPRTILAAMAIAFGIVASSATASWAIRAAVPLSPPAGSGSGGSGSSGSGSASATGTANGSGGATLDRAADQAFPVAPEAANALAFLPPALPTSTPAATDPAAQRAACTELLLANRAAADEIFATVNAEQAKQLIDARGESHQRAAKAIAKNQRHVILAYAAMWILAVGFVTLLWLRQAKLRRQIESLRAELERATKA